MSKLGIVDVNIDTDHQGRLNLNQIHKVYGGGKNTGPSVWRGQERTRLFIEALQKETDEVNLFCTIEGHTGGTFAHELLAIHYAFWLSPDFSLLVCKGFLRYKELERVFAGG